MTEHQCCAVLPSNSWAAMFILQGSSALQETASSRQTNQEN